MAAGALLGAAPSSSSLPSGMTTTPTTATTVEPEGGGSSPVPTTAPLASSAPPDYLPRFKARIEERQRKMQQRKPVLVASRLSETSTIDSNSKLSAFAESKNQNPGISANSDDGVLLPGSSETTSGESLPSFPVTAPMPLPEATTPPKPIKVDSEGNADGKADENGEVTDFIGSIWDKMKIKLGFTPDCLNGGTKRSSGMCVCRTYFSGDQCQKRECINNGTLTKTHKNPIKEVCLCPHPQYISGGHCEIVHCMNGGRFVNGSCLCVDNWYTGQFCEHYAASWFAVLGIPLVCIAVIAFCCVICRLDFCPKRNLATASSRSGTRHHRNRAHAEHRSTVSHNLRRPPSNPDRPRYHPVFYDLDDGLPAMVRENPLHSNQHICGLANYPEYNPALPAPPSSDDFKPIEPPPSYEQAVATCSTIIPATPVLQQRLPQTSHSNSVPPPPTYSPPRPLLAHQSSLSSTSDSSRTRGR